MTQSKFNPNKNGKAMSQKSAPLDPITGLYLRLGNGCHFQDNCFTCPESPNACHYGSSVKEERQFPQGGLNVSMG